MNHFLFITHSTPLAKRTTLRNDLNKIYIKSLVSQTYKNFDVAILGDPFEVNDHRFHFFDLPDDKTKVHQNIQDILSSSKFQELLNKANYIVKLDDDDIISPHVLEKLKEFTGDVYFDEYHTFVDLTSGIITQQKRNWIASTCVHKKEHAFSSIADKSAINLLYSDHSKTWHEYYKDKIKVIAPKDHPVYLRVLSPTSITAGRLIQNDSKFDFDSIKQQYYEYLALFGNWNKCLNTDFDIYLPELKNAWENFSQKNWENPILHRKEVSLVQRIKNKIKTILKRM